MSKLIILTFYFCLKILQFNNGLCKFYCYIHDTKFTFQSGNIYPYNIIGLRNTTIQHTDLLFQLYYCPTTPLAHTYTNTDHNYIHVITVYRTQTLSSFVNIARLLKCIIYDGG